MNKNEDNIAVIFYGFGRDGEKCKSNFQDNLLDSLRTNFDLQSFIGTEESMKGSS